MADFWSAEATGQTSTKRPLCSQLGGTLWEATGQTSTKRPICSQLGGTLWHINTRQYVNTHSGNGFTGLVEIHIHSINSIFTLNCSDILVIAALHHVSILRIETG